MKTDIQRYMQNPKASSLIQPKAWEFMQSADREIILNNLIARRAVNLTKAPGYAKSILSINNVAEVTTDCGHSEFIGVDYLCYLELNLGKLPDSPEPLVFDPLVAESHAAQRAYNRTPDGMRARLGKLQAHAADLVRGPAKSAIMAEIQKIKLALKTIENPVGAI